MCSLPKEDDQFYKKGKWLQSRCKDCKRQANHAHYHANKPRYLDNRSVWRKGRRSKVAEIKSKKGCAVCKEDAACCLDFHHRDRIEKKFEVSRRVECSWEEVLAEIEKCVVLCKNCHAKVHAGVILL